MTWCIRNFGRNVLFTPEHVRAPQTEDDILAVLEEGRVVGIRAGGSLHGWSDGIATPGIFVDMRWFARVTVTHQTVDGFRLITVGGGCPLEFFLDVIRRQGYTLPTIGTITRQTVAGAVSTATHGSGRSSLSHYVHRMRIAAYDDHGDPVIRDWTDEEALKMLRCGAGCTGLIVSVTFRCVPVFQVAERVRLHDSLSSVLSTDNDALDEFAVVPYLWKFVGYHRTVREPAVTGFRWMRAWPRRTLYRVYKLVAIDWAFHLLLCTILGLHRFGRWGGRSAERITKSLFRKTKLLVGLGVVLTARRGVVDESQRALTRKHYLFRHVEMEVFVGARDLEPVVEMLRTIVDVFAGTGAGIPEPVANRLAPQSLDDVNLLQELERHAGSYVHHYPLYFRRVFADATAISMTSDAGNEGCYAIGLFCYGAEKRRFYALARFVATSMMRCFGARLHWGKYMPMFPEPAVGSVDLEQVYPHLPAFRDWCAANVDPNGVFHNDYSRRVLGFSKRKKMAGAALIQV